MKPKKRHLNIDFLMNSIGLSLEDATRIHNNVGARTRLRTRRRKREKYALCPDHARITARIEREWREGK